MAAAVYLLCALTAALCAALLLQSYRRGRYGLLLWSGLCFAVLAVNNVMVMLDKVVLATVDLSLWRSGTALVAMVILLYGLVWHAE